MTSYYIGAYRREKESPSGFQRIETGENTTVTWGAPAMITQAKMDKCCPVCGKTRADGFDLGIDPETNEIFGARCGTENGGCGFSF